MNTININRKPISSAEIETFKNFNSIIANKPNTPSKMPQNNMWMKFGLSGVAVASIIAFVYIINKPKNAEITGNKVVTGKYINPPIPKCDVPYQSIMFYNTADTTLIFDKTSKIEIKKNAVVDSLGNSVTGPVEIRFRQFMNPSEIFLSGIPMEYDSAGQKSTFESAGMIEIFAIQQNKRLHISAKKPILVSFESEKSSTTFNLYQLDTIKKNWVYKGKDNVVKPTKLQIHKDLNAISAISPIQDSLRKIQTIILQVIQTKPQLPLQANPQKWHFNIDILANEFPDLAIYSNTIFEIDESYKPLNPAHPKITWTDAVIEKSSMLARYFVTFKKDSQTCKYLVSPVFTGKNYTAELNKYEHDFNQYKILLEKRKKEEYALQQQLLAWEKQFREDSIEYVNRQLVYATEEKFTRSFRIMDFGIWNCDQPIRFTNAQKIMATYNVDHAVYDKVVYLVDESRNALIKYYPGGNLRFSRNSKNMIWMVTPKNELAIFKPNEFKNIPENAASYIFNLTRVDKKINSSKDFIKLYKNGFED